MENNQNNGMVSAFGASMPAEYEQHDGCLMIWPERPGSWIYGAKAAQKAFAQIAVAIARSEKLYMLATPGMVQKAEETLLCQKETEERGGIHDCDIKVIPMESDDAWARDVGPTFVLNKDGKRRQGENSIPCGIYPVCILLRNRNSVKKLFNRISNLLGSSGLHLFKRPFA